MTRRARIGAVIAALAAIQLGAVAIYLAVERARGPGAAVEGAARWKAERLGAREAAPAFAATRRDGSAAPISWPAPRPRLVHFWGTWCEPCRRELPALLAFARDTPGIELVAVAVDDPWASIERFFGGAIPPEVVVPIDAATHQRYGASTLPDSYLVDRAGQLVERYHGARDWQSAAARVHVAPLLR
jgi:thiol-disulfide isomerase/thioredoxin